MRLEAQRARRRAEMIAGFVWFFGGMAWICARYSIREALSSLRGGR